MKKVIVTSYVNPDLDATACMVAYTKLLKTQKQNADFVIFGEPQAEARFAMQYFNYHFPDIKYEIDGSEDIVLVDTNYSAELGGKIDYSKVASIIDHHHINNKSDFPNAQWQIEMVGAAATLIFEKYEAGNIKPSAAIAGLLYGAIVSNTLNFNGNIVTERDKEAASKLKSLASVPDDFTHKMFAAKSKVAAENLKSTLVNDFTYLNFAGRRIGLAQLEIVNAEELVRNRENELLEILDFLKGRDNLETVILNALDLEKGYTLFIISNTGLQTIFSDILGVKFSNHIGRIEKLTLRKQFIPLLKKHLDPNYEPHV